MADAEYMHVTKKQCYQTTRTGIQSTIMEHLSRGNSRFVWVQGSPGTGKTAIAKSVASRLAEERRLAASFFWDKTGARINADSIEQFPSTLASQLAIFSRDYETLLVNRLLDRSSRNILRVPLEERMNSLIVQPMNSISQAFSSEEGYCVVVLDGLDECGSRSALAKLMGLVLILDNLPPNFTILVSARPEPEIRAAFHPFHGISCVYTDEISQDDTGYTIRVMVERGLDEIRQLHHSSWVPSENTLRDFVGTCRELPVLAEIRVREVGILASSGHTLRDAFRIVKDDGAMSKDLNDDYLRILRRAYRRVNPAPHSTRTGGSTMPNTALTASPDVLRTYHEAVGTVIAARRPLSVQTISNILAIPEENIRAVLDPIGSIISTPISDDDPVHFYHATAEEFLTGLPQGDEVDQAFFFSDVKGTFLAFPLLNVLNNSLKRNMANMVDPTLLEYGERTRLDKVPKHVSYAAEHWATHLDLSSASEELWKELRLFLTTKLLFWIELSMDHGSALLTVLEQEKVSSNSIEMIL